LLGRSPGCFWRRSPDHADGAAGYFAAILASAVLLAISARSPCVLLTALVLPTMHFAWGAAFLGRLITNWRRTIEILSRP